MAGINKGELLQVGHRGKEYETKIGVIKVEITGIGLVILLFYLLYLAYIGVFVTPNGSPLVDALITFILGIFTLWALPYFE